MLNRKQFIGVLALGLSLGLPLTSQAQERSTKEQAKAMVEAAIAHVKSVGVQQAFKDFQNDKAHWVKNDLYVFAYDMHGTCLVLGANAHMVGKNLIDMKDPSGKYIQREMIALTSTKGSGWVSYQFADPLTKKMGSKMSFVEKVPGFDGFIGVGVYL